MKIILINPFDRSTCTYSTHFPPLGVGYIAALTPPAWELEFIDENFEVFVPRKADLVAITAMTIQANRAYELCRIYKEMGVPVILGGIHASMVPEEALKYARSVVIGEAESLWPSVLDDFLNRQLRQIYKSNSYPSLQNLVMPRRNIFNKKYWFDCIQTSRGCPFSCDFCSVPSFNGRSFRLRPVDEVIEELKTIQKRFVFFVDDNIVGFGKENEERAIALFEGILRCGIKKHWISQASVNIAKNEYLLKLMRRTGCLGLLIGFESIDKANLQKSGKFQNLRNGGIPHKFYKEVIHKLHRNGIAVNGYFCYGYEDTKESILESLNFILSSGIDITNFPILIPSPGTALYKKLYDKIDFKNYPEDWNKYLGRLVYCPRNTNKKEFYKGYILAAKRINSMKQVLKRGFQSLIWSKSPFQSLMILLFNFGYRKLRQFHFSIMLRQDPEFRSAHAELENKNAPYSSSCKGQLRCL
jgi:radical SAM superfamily enzyme YgiQ (UPF0313 family)